MLTLKLWLKETDWFSKNPEKYSTTKIGKYVPCRYLTSTIWAFDSIENKHSLYRGEDCMKKFCSSSLKEHAATHVINFVKKKMLLLTKKKELKSHHQQDVSFV